MNYEEWIKKYQPRMSKQGQVFLYETFGSELEMIKMAKPDHVWTLVDGDDDNWLFIPGIHYVNRIAYAITEKPHLFETLEVNA